MPASPRYPRRKGGECSRACRLADSGNGNGLDSCLLQGALRRRGAHATIACQHLWRVSEEALMVRERLFGLPMFVRLLQDLKTGHEAALHPHPAS
jgi:hypothetical protein